jgi:hypothetical protein
VRLITNVEGFATATGRHLHAAVEFPDQRVLGRRNALAVRLVRSPHRARGTTGWKIVAKQVNLIECDQCIRNPSIIL